MSYNQNKNPDEVGAIWIRSTKAGDKYCSISVTIDGKKHELVAFKNKYKTDSEADQKKPDYRVLKSKDRQATPTPTPSQAFTQGTSLKDEDIPF